MDRSRPGERVAAFHATGTGVTRIGYPIGVRTLALIRRVEVTASMLRLTLGGPELAGFHSYQCDDHVKVVLPDPDGSWRLPVPGPGEMLRWPRPLPRTRKYTVRRLDPDALELDLDVVLHPGGLASEWAQRLAVGEDVVVAGPPGAKAFAQTYDHYLFAVDPTALPAAARWLEEAPREVSADLVVDTDHRHEQDYPLAPRAGVRVHWLDRSAGSQLAETVRALPRPGATFLFAAGEAEDLMPLRGWARDAGVDSLVTGYWRRGVAGLDD